MSSNPPSSAHPAPDQGISTSDELTEVFAPGTVAPKSVFPTSPHALPVGARIGEFEVHRLIGEGGFGIVYLCYDQALDRYVALKEYMPSSLATRENATLAIVVKSKHHTETFQAGMKSFINEARLLAQFDHPSLVKVYRFWQANGTAYMTMPFYEGPTLKQALAALGQPPDEATLRAWLEPMLDALDEIHRFSCYHRDIAPDNILLTAAGPLLLDFGAARRVIGDMTQALTVVLKPGFAPIEQYGDAAAMSQGAWTDLYALASVVYYAITGRPPMSAVDRLMDDKLEPLTHRVAGRYSHALLAAVDTALSVRPQDRPQNVAAFRALIQGGGDGPTTDLHLWADDEAPTEMHLPPPATQPGALGGNEPRTVPLRPRDGGGADTVPGAFAPTAIGPRSAESAVPHPHTAPQPPQPIGSHPATVFAATLPQTVLAPRPAVTPPATPAGRVPPGPEPLPPTVTLPGFGEAELPPASFMPNAAAPWAPVQNPAAPAPRQPPNHPAAAPAQGAAPLAPPAAPVAGGAFGAGLAPLSGGMAQPMPPRPPMAERTAMPSLLPPAPRPGTAAEPGRPGQAPASAAGGRQPAASAASPQHLGLWLTGAALVLAALVAAWTFTRPGSDADTMITETADPPATPSVAPQPPSTTPPPTSSANAPVPTPVPAQAPETVPPRVSPAPSAVQSAPTPPPPQPAPATTTAEQTPTPARPTANAPDNNGSPAIRLGSQPRRSGNPGRSEEDDSPIVLPPRGSTTRTEAPSPAPRPTARCNDIRQRAGLEDLSADERHFLRTQCR